MLTIRTSWGALEILENEVPLPTLSSCSGKEMMLLEVSLPFLSTTLLLSKSGGL